MGHRMLFSRLVKAGKTSMERLERDGLLLKAKRPWSDTSTEAVRLGIITPDGMPVSRKSRAKAAK